ncbi:MAG TPA: DUF4861 family protein [Paludibacter sp.]|nr:DUF4861 family protein [Paludibacter sp.]
MKRSILLFIPLLLSVGIFSQKSVTVTNSTSLGRKGELVEVVYKPANTFVLKDNNGEEVGYQLVYNSKKEVAGFLFQADVKAKSKATYWIKDGTPAPVKAKTFGRFVPERKDDFAWENDFAAYRMYGPALAKENPSNGVDFWSKCTSELIIDQRYRDELQNGKSYHIDHGNGMDFYKVGHALGCGGVAPYADDSLWVGNHFDSYEVLENGPLRTKFKLTYNKFDAGGSSYKETYVVTACAGSLLNKAVVSYDGLTREMQLATGIFLHDGKGTIRQEPENGILCYAENAFTELAKEPCGRNYVGVVAPGKKVVKKNNHAFILTNYSPGTSMTYYFGAGWNKCNFPTDADWFKAVNDFAAKTKSPLKVKVK